MGNRDVGSDNVNKVVDTRKIISRIKPDNSSGNEHESDDNQSNQDNLHPPLTNKWQRAPQE